jgi:hypothetical protein
LTQSRDIWHSQRVFKRVEDMAGIKDLGCYQTYALRTINYKTRLKFIEWTLEGKQRQKWIGNNRWDCRPCKRCK